MKIDLNNKKNSGFKAPDGYFESLEDIVLSKIKTNTSLKTIKTSGFNMPKNYFDSIEDKVIDRIQLQDNETKVINLFTRKNLVYISGIAAALILTFTVLFNNESVNQNLDLQLVEDYIINEGIDAYELALLLTEDELSTIDAEVYEEALNDESMEDYLLENVSLEEIIEQ